MLASFFLAALVASAAPARAAEPETMTTVSAIATSAFMLQPLAGDVDWSLPPVLLGGPRRGAMLPALYVGLAGLNAFDAYSTVKGLSRGATEGNPLMQPAAGSSAAMWAIKGGVTAGSIAVAERLWRQNRRGAAITMMVVSNVIVATAAARNVQILGRQ